MPFPAQPAREVSGYRGGNFGVREDAHAPLSLMIRSAEVRCSDTAHLLYLCQQCSILPLFRRIARRLPSARRRPSIVDKTVAEYATSLLRYS